MQKNRVRQITWAKLDRTDIFVTVKMPQQRDFSQTTPCQNRLVEYACQHLDGDCFPTERVLRRNDQAVCALTEFTQSGPPVLQVEYVIEQDVRLISPIRIGGRLTFKRWKENVAHLLDNALSLRGWSAAPSLSFPELPWPTTIPRFTILAAAA